MIGTHDRPRVVARACRSGDRGAGDGGATVSSHPEVGPCPV